MSKKLVFAFVVSAATALAGCNSDSGTSTGPNAVGANGQIISDTFAPVSGICNGNPQGKGPPTLVINGTSGTFSQALSGCTNSGTLTLAYSGSNGLSLTQNIQLCNGSSSVGCGSNADSNSCTPSATPQTPLTGTFTGSGSTLVITFTNSTCGSSGGTATEVDTWTAQ